ncbi:hypothetical protein G6L37_00900 [Agrobacterium rubi]|nr:hypothetical protein [Agrobacterium rubi]NTF23949.1 hypothetical protein [Agrobacterium rubi]
MDSDISDVRIETIERRACLYRAGHRDGGQGLWYDADGRETGVIHSLAEGSAAALPMGPHPVFRADGGKWISTAENLTDLGFWFSRNDMLEMIGLGYELQEITVERYRTLHFPGYSHPVYRAEDVIEIRVLDPMIPYPDRAA